MGQRKSGLLRQVNSEKRFNSDEYFITEEEKGDLLIEVTTITYAGLTVTAVS